MFAGYLTALLVVETNHHDVKHRPLQLLSAVRLHPPSRVCVWVFRAGPVRVFRLMNPLSPGVFNLDTVRRRQRGTTRRRGVSVFRFVQRRERAGGVTAKHFRLRLRFKLITHF